MRCKQIVERLQVDPRQPAITLFGEHIIGALCVKQHPVLYLVTLARLPALIEVHYPLQEERTVANATATNTV